MYAHVKVKVKVNRENACTQSNNCRDTAAHAHVLPV